MVGVNLAHPGGITEINHVAKDNASHCFRHGSGFILTVMCSSSPLSKPMSGLQSLRVFALLLSALATVTGSLSAQVDFSQEELRALPRVCLAQKFINEQLQFPVVSEQERQQWTFRLGEKDYNSYHHYCWALLYIRRGNAERAPAAKAHNFSLAVDNFNYVQKNATIHFPLMPEVNLQKGLALRLLADDAGAAREFMTAIKLKRTYTPAYAALIDVHMALGNREGAEAVLQEGLRHAPNSKLLAQKKLEIDIWRPDPR